MRYGRLFYLRVFFSFPTSPGKKVSKQWFMLKIVNWNWQIKLESLAVHYRIINETQFHHIPFCHCSNEIGDSSPFMSIERKIKMLPKMVYLCWQAAHQAYAHNNRFSVQCTHKKDDSVRHLPAFLNLFAKRYLRRKAKWHVCKHNRRDDYYSVSGVNMEHHMETQMKLKHRQIPIVTLNKCNNKNQKYI